MSCASSIQVQAAVNVFSSTHQSSSSDVLLIILARAQAPALPTPLPTKLPLHNITIRFTYIVKYNILHMWEDVLLGQQYTFGK